MKWTIRQAADKDQSAIEALTRAAFAGKPYSDGTEADLAERLGEAGALVLSLVAVRNKFPVGHVALSPARIGDTRCLALGPLAVAPDHQGQGIGSALVNHAVAVAGAYGRGGVVLLGDPAFYGRLGFMTDTARLTYKGAASDHLQITGFDDAPQGDVVFHPAFG